MPPGFNAHFDKKDFQRMLDNLEPKNAEKVIKDGLRAGGKVFQTAVAARAPERPDVPAGDALPPGALKTDVEVHLGHDENGFLAAIIGPGKFTNRIAIMVEYGHRLVRGGYNRLIKSGKNAGKTRGPGTQVGTVPEHPFIRPAFEATREEAVQVAVTAIAEGLEKAAKKK